MTPVSNHPPHKWAAPLVLLLLGFVWGSSFILMKMGLIASDGSALFPPLELASLRIAIAGFALLPISIRHFRKVERQHWKWIALVGVIGSFIPAMLFATAQVQLPSAVAGMLNALSPLWTLLIAVAVFGVSFHRGQVFGLALGLLGALGLIWNPADPAWSASDWHQSIVPGLLLVVATMCYGISVNITREKLREMRSPIIAACSLGLVALPASVLFVTGEIPSLIMHHPDGVRGLGAVVVLAAVGTAAALVLFNQLIAWTSAVVAASVTYIIPVFATIWGWIDGEALLPSHIFSGALIMLGVWVTNRMGARKRAAEKQVPD